jgi:hypothetical protein
MTVRTAVLTRAARPKRHLRRLAILGVALLAIVVTAGGSQALPYPQPPPPGWPILPPRPPSVPFYNIGYLYAGGLAAAPKAQTTVRQSIQLQYAPQANYSQIYQGHNTQFILAYPFPLSPAGTPDQFGEFAPVLVKTLAFGSLPITLTLHVSLTRVNGRPVTLSLTQADYSDKTGLHSVIPPTLSGRVNIRIDDVAIDGLPLDVGPSCQTLQPAILHATAQAWYNPAVRPDPPSATNPAYFSVYSGGYFVGTVDSPAFSGCRHGSENLDALFTENLSGTSQLEVNTTGVWLGPLDFCYPTPPPSGLLCGPLDELPLPTNPVHK